MNNQASFEFEKGEVVSLPFFENEKFVVGSKRLGGMGSVYQLIPLIPKPQIFALKTYHGNVNSSQFEHEAKIWISLGTNKNIAQALVYGILQNTRCILVLWYSKNMLDLDPLKMSSKEINDFASGIIAGLSYAYDRLKLIHKDIKPMNILVDNQGNPRIADFGISSYIPDDILNKGLYLKPTKNNFRENGTVGEISGTPFYIAPELFSGSGNSIQTDIFALGVTLFEWLAKMHPFLGADGRYDESMIERGISFIRGHYDSGISHLCNLISLAIELDTDMRPVSYRELLHNSGFNQALVSEVQDPSKAGVPEIVSASQVLRKQEKFQEAGELLAQNLAKRPSDPILLNAYASLFVELGRVDEAIPYLEQSVDELRKTNGNYRDQPYIDSYLNLALHHIDRKNFEVASGLLQETLENFGTANKGISFMFWEFGWMYLYEGKFTEAVELLLLYLSRKKASATPIGLLCLAIYLSGKKEQYFRACFDLIAAEGSNEVSVGQYLCVIGSYLDISRLHRLNTQLLTPQVMAALKNMSVAISGTEDYFKIPMSDEMIRRTLRRVNSQYVGEKHHGLL